MRIALLSAIIAFFVTLIITPWFIRYLRKIGLEVKDMNKKDTPLVPISGGVTAFAGIFIGLLAVIFTQTFIYNNSAIITPLLAALITITIITFIGFVDDLIIQKSKETSAGLKQWQKPLLTLAAAVPLMVVNAGTKIMSVPLFGRVDFGMAYPLILVPIGVVGAANMINMLAGFNGLETGLGLVYMGMLSIYAYVNHSEIGFVIAMITFMALLAFLIFNRYPAKVLPGDSLTYMLGASLACVAILGNMERAALICSVPFFIEFALKLKSRLKAKSYGFYKNGKVQSFYKKIYSIPHIFTRTGKFTEKQIVIFLMLIELAFSLLMWL